MVNQSSLSTPTSVIGTWQAVNINQQRQIELAVVQFKSDGTFIEGFDLANHASSYSGRYSYDSASQRIAFIIDSAAGTGPQPVPFHQSALSSNVFFGNPTTVRLNNDLTFAFKSASVAPSDFVLPPFNAPLTVGTFNDGFSNHMPTQPFTPTFGFNSPFF